MNKQIKIFCDESNHLYTDKSDLMVLGGISCPFEEVEFVNRYIKYLKHKHNANHELKWTKLNNNKKDFYIELLEFFFSSINLKFNAQLIMNKSRLTHDIYNDGESDKFYYKMYYYVLNPFLQVENNYNIFLDYKDTKGGKRIKELKDVISSSFYGHIDTQFSIIHSHESQIMQLTDLFIGAIGYANREDIPKKSEIKNFIVSKIQEIGGLSVCESSSQWEKKFRLYKFFPRKKYNG